MKMRVFCETGNGRWVTIDKEGPHVGFDDAGTRVSLYYSKALSAWVERTSNMYICHCEPCEEEFERKLLKHGNITRVNEF